MNKQTLSRSLRSGLVLWVGLSVIFVLGNESGGSENTVSVFPTLLSPVFLLVFLFVVIRSEYLRGEKGYRALVNSASHVVGFAALMSIPVHWVYSYQYFDERSSGLAWSGALMSFVWTWVVGYAFCFLVAWFVIKRSSSERMNHAG